MAGLVPQAIVLALGAGTLGGPEALRLLLQFAGRSPAVDVATCVVVISLLTAPLLGTMLLARFVREARAGGGGGAPVTDVFAKMTATLSVGAAFLVTACLLAVPGGDHGAVRLPIDFAANSPVAVTVLAICAAAAARKARAGGGGASATDVFAKMTVTLSVGAAFLATACLLAVPGGGHGAVRLPIDFAANNPVAVTVLAICAAAAAAGSHPCAVPLLRFLRGAANPGDGAPAARASERFSWPRQAVCFIFIALLLAAVSSAASGGLDAQRLFLVFACQSPITDVPVAVAVAIAAVAGTTLVARFSRRMRSATTGAGAAAPTPATGTWRRGLGKLASQAGVLSMSYAHSQSGSESDGGEHANSACAGGQAAACAVQQQVSISRNI